MRENIVLSNAEIIAVEDDGAAVTGYIHNQIAPNMGTMACIVGLQGGDEVGSQIALHVAAASPKYLNVHIPETDLEREAAILREQGLASGKPAELLKRW